MALVYRRPASKVKTNIRQDNRRTTINFAPDRTAVVLRERFLSDWLQKQSGFKAS